MTFLGGFLIWNDAAFCGGRIQLKIFVSVCSDMWKSLERDSANYVFYYLDVLWVLGSLITGEGPAESAGYIIV